MQDFADLLRHSIDLEDRVKWLEKGLKLIIKLANDKESGLAMAAQSILDGELTTADEHNCMIQYRDTGDENDYGETRNAQHFSASTEKFKSS
tara:strand:+ start:1528 stop:1803 length:276 start_codon:yes stop_codon:yes gene_type:complete